MKAKYLFLIICIIVVSDYVQAQSKTQGYFKYKCGMSKEEVESIEKRKLVFWHSGMFGNPIYYLRNVNFHGRSTDIFYYSTEKKIKSVSVIFKSDIRHPENSEQEFLKIKHEIIQELGIAPTVFILPPSLDAKKPLLDIIFKDKGAISLVWFLKGRSVGLSLSHHPAKVYEMEISYSCSRKAMGLGPYKPKKSKTGKNK